MSAVVIRHRELEDALANPGDFAVAGRDQPRMRYNTTMLLYNAVHGYHRDNDDLESAIAYLESEFDRHESEPGFRRPARLPELVTLITDYDEKFRELGTIFADNRVRVRMPISTELEIRGELPRLDVNPNDGGYAAWLFTQEPLSWHMQLRMPLLQQYFAREMMVDLAAVTVGFYDFGQAEYESTRYSREDVDGALEAARELGLQIAEIRAEASS